MNLLPLKDRGHRDAHSSSPQSIIAFDRRAARPLPIAEERDPRAEPRKLRLGHVHLKVRDLDRSVPFYTRMLGLRLTERVGRYAFLAMGEEHHSLALEAIGGWAVKPSRRAVGVAHVAFEVSDRAAFVAMRRKLRDAMLPFQSRNNGISWTMRFKDPDGNEIEIYVDRRHAPGGGPLWGGRWHGLLPRESEPARRIASAA